ncbi:MAG: Bax inhibitor-1/YccA family protein [Chloroflexota bacterium]|nr:Bax inhibitor-1/YccA family protein [Chloroflexota bacterium]
MALQDILSTRTQPNQFVQTGSYEAARPLLKWTYIWMFFGLIITGVVALVTSTNEAMIAMVTAPGFGIMAFIVQIGIALGMGFALQRISPALAAGLYMLYAFVTGLTFSVIFLVFSIGTIGLAFFSAAVLFAVMSVFAFTTKTDLSRFGNILMIGLIGVLIVTVINIFIGSSFLTMLISIVGLVVFLGLTAYDTQNIQRMAMHPEVQANQDLMTKLGIFSAFQLYINFIMIFIYLLQIFGIMGGNND